MDTWNMIGREIVTFFDQLAVLFTVSPIPLLVIFIAPAAFTLYVIYQGIKAEKENLDELEDMSKSLDTSEEKHVPLFSRALVVDDNPLFLDYLEEILQEKGITVYRAHNGQEALDILLEDPYHNIDVVISDIKMPNLDGTELCERNRGYHPILLVSGEVMASDEGEHIYGSHGFLEKDKIHDDIFPCVEKAIETWMKSDYHRDKAA